MQINLSPIAFVKNSRKEPIDDHWEEITSEIELAEDIPTEAFEKIELFSHLEIIFYLNKVDNDKIVFARRPRGNVDYPMMGILAQRNKDRPNAIGLTTVELVAHYGRNITVRYLDAIDGTPILDIKPVFKGFQPQGEIKQPDWVADLMKNYWQ
ncbi:MAG: tRNA (N6-threonylcarbamoyladenosine(37)-N6)-methyltransferase TrmO [Chitinophagaceae bacterium]